jgi:ApaG protein
MKTIMKIRMQSFNTGKKTTQNSIPQRRRVTFHTTAASSTDLVDAAVDKVRLATLRLYRILQRTCTEFDDKQGGSDSSSSILLQPNLEAPDWGRHAIYTPHKPTQVDELYRLFYVWNDSLAADDERELGVFRGRLHHDYDVDDNNNNTSPSRKTTTSRCSSSTTSTYIPSSIDDWYYELVSRRKQLKGSGESSMSLAIPPMTSMTCWTSQSQLQEAVRAAFRTLKYDNTNRLHRKDRYHQPYNDDDHASASLLDSTDLHKWAIRAIQILQEQQTLWRHSSMATTDGIVRITATSRCIGMTAPTPTTIPPSVTTPQILADATPKYRFAYRIRVENVSDDQTVQLMGRYWHIAEESNDDDFSSLPPPIEVDSPVTGAVGQLPVLQPGQVFEYMSGTDLAKPRGTMKGFFYMARVPSNTRSAKSGDNLELLLKQRQKQQQDRKQNTNCGGGQDEDHREIKFFKATVAPFPLEA